MVYAVFYGRYGTKKFLNKDMALKFAKEKVTKNQATQVWLLKGLTPSKKILMRSAMGRRKDAYSVIAKQYEFKTKIKSFYP